MNAEQKRGKSRKPSVSPARRVAFEVLRRVETEEAFASVLLASATSLSREDHALAHEITLGVLRWQSALDSLIEQYSGRSVEKLDAPVLLALRLGLYQLRYLTRIPASAAVNESVNLVKLARKTSAAAMVNAVLRKAARNPELQAGANIANVAPIGDALERESVEVSHPRWMLARWMAAFGDQEARQLAAANNRAPRLAFRVNTLRSTVDETLAALRKAGVQIQPSAIIDGAFVISDGAGGEILRLAEQGFIYLQDEASQLVSLLLDAKPGHRILDLCAAPGSKTSHLAALTENRAPIIASDLHTHRLATLQTTCQRLGVRSVDAVVLDATEDATQSLPFIERALPFDRVLVDAPCTGTGTLRRHPEIKWRLQPHDITRLAQVQQVLLERAAGVLATGGRLVYSTCSIEPEENEEIVKRFLNSNSDFHLIRPGAPPCLMEDCISNEGFVRTFPHRHNTDGFFAAVLEKKK